MGDVRPFSAGRFEYKWSVCSSTTQTDIQDPARFHDKFVVMTCSCSLSAQWLIFMILE